MSNIDDSKLSWWQEMQARHGGDKNADQPELGLKGGGGGNTYDPMEGRVAKLEAYVEVCRDDLREIRGDLKAILSKFGTIPTKADLSGWKWQWLVVSATVFALIVLALIGGLAWLDAR